nr:probable pectate lyase 12 [Tanacetum cinerariifolium]GFA46469.1 probable pectate lyase 12 [Tanacetum cinerariifolium]
WEMYEIGGSGNPTTDSQGNRYTSPANPNVEEFESTTAIMTGPELNTTNELLSKLLGTIGINCTTATTNHTSTPTVVAYHTGPPHLAGPTAGPVPPGFPPKVHYTPTVLIKPNPTAPYNYNMMPAQSNVTPTGLPSQPTSITI